MSPSLIDAFGGLCTSIDAGDLPTGLAIAATDMEFFPGGAQSRVPFVNYIKSAGSGPLGADVVNSIMSYPCNDGTRRRLFFLDNGTLQVEYPEGIITTVETLLGKHQMMRGCVLNNRAWMAFSDGKTPGTRPRWYNYNGWFDPVGQEGGSTSPGYTLSGSAGNATASAPYDRQVNQMYETRGGFITLPSGSNNPNTNVTLNSQYAFNTITVPPSNVVKTRIGMTTNQGSAFYSPSSLVSMPPTLTQAFTAAWDSSHPGYSDTEVANGMLMTHARLNSWPLPPCLGLEAYNGRLVAWGALNYIPKLLLDNQGQTTSPVLVMNYTAGFKNLTFTGGLGTTDPTGFTVGASGGAIVAESALPGCALTAWKVTGNGNATTGELTGLTYIQRFDDFPIGVEWRCRIRAKRSASVAAGRINFGVTGGAQVQYLATNLTEDWAWYDTGASWVGGAMNGNVVFPASGAGYDTVGYPHLFVDQTLTSGQWIAIDEIQVYPATQPKLQGYLLISEPNDLETFDYTHGILGVRPGDGQTIMNCVELRGVLYAFKERSIFAVSDNGSDPYQWTAPALMSDAVGCLSVHGVGRGDGWLCTISEAGVFTFAGGQPNKISQEVQPTWNKMNFAYRHLAWCVVDSDAQRIYVAIPTGTNQFCDTLLTCDFVAGLDDPIASPGGGRKWSVWTPPGAPGFTCGTRMDRDDGHRTFVVGGGTTGSAGFISAIGAPSTWGTTTDTFGAATPTIASVYETATVGQPVERSFFGYVVAKMRGNGGTVKLSLQRPDGTTVNEAVRTIATAQLHDIEWQIAQQDTQVGLKFEAQAGGAFAIKRAAAFYKSAASSKVRGVAA